MRKILVFYMEDCGKCEAMKHKVKHIVRKQDINIQIEEYNMNEVEGLTKALDYGIEPTDLPPQCVLMNNNGDVIKFHQRTKKELEKMLLNPHL